MEPTLDDVAAAYIEYGRTQSPDLLWAFEAVTLLAFEQRWEELWTLTLRAIELVPFEDTEALCFVAAGPLEDLIRYAAPIVQERIVRRIEEDPKFRRTLTGAWAREERPDFWSEVTPLLYRHRTEPLA